MKGTFFSADLIKTETGQIKLLEINTDTVGSIDEFDWNGFKEVLLANNISSLHLIYKPFQSLIIESLSSFLKNSSDTSDIDIVLHIEDINSIYPIEIEDSENDFILRLSYSESAILDSEYAKNNLNLYNLFIESNQFENIPDYCFTSSLNEINLLTSSSLNNEENIPDFVVKPVLDNRSDMNFYKVGKSELSYVDRITEFINTVKDEDKYIQKFYNTSINNRVSSIRTYQILYSTELLLIEIYTGIYQSSFELPETSSIVIDDNIINNLISNKHFYEYSTNDFKVNSSYENGLFEEEVVIKSDNTLVEVKNIVEGDILKSYHVEGSPDTDDYLVLNNWYSTGSTMPSGSYETTTTVFDNVQVPLRYNHVLRIELENNLSFRIGSNTLLLVYNTIEDKIKFIVSSHINPSIHKLFLSDDSLLGINEIYHEILDGDYNTNSLNVEEDDVYYLSLNDGDGNIPLPIKVLVHNCFVAGTKVTMNDKTTKNIEDIREGDEVLTYNVENKNFESGKVGAIRVGESTKIVEITDERGISTKVTPTHKYFTANRGWDFAQNLTTEDILFDDNGNEIKITNIKKYEENNKVYHLLNVENSHTFFANSSLVHNIKTLCCFLEGAPVEMSNGSVTPIEDVKVGDLVKSYDYKTNTYTDSKVLSIDHEWTVGSHKEACEYLGNAVGVYKINDNDFNFSFTPEHPFLTEDGWKALVPYDTQEPFKTEQESKKLEVGDKILHNGEWVEIYSITHIPTESNRPVYNLHIENTSTYIVDGVVVHNKLPQE